jgi:hypothetical protein
MPTWREADEGGMYADDAAFVAVLEDIWSITSTSAVRNEVSATVGPVYQGRDSSPKANTLSGGIQVAHPRLRNYR